MRRYAVVGNPVRHSLSPWIHTHFGRVLQKNIVYGAHAPQNFADFARQFFLQGGQGLNITAPFKKDALQFAARATSFARRAQAANVLTIEADGTIAACNTDGAGLLKDIRRNLKVDIDKRRIVIAGAGGAARAAALALSQQNAEIVIAARNLQAAQELAKQCDGEAMTLQQCDGGDIILNATSAGRNTDGKGCSPLPSSAFSKTILAYDLNYGPAAAPFLQAAASASLRADGSGMLVEQAAASFAIWENILPPSADLIEVLRNRHNSLWQ